MTGWTAIVPVKPWSLAKTRLILVEDDRARLARAFSLDVLQAVSDSLHVRQVVIVSAERGISKAARTMGAVVLTDRPMLSLDGLNDALAQGRGWAASRRPDDPVVVVPADLPALTGGALDESIEMLDSHDTAFVPDASGRGTTLYAAQAPSLMYFQYGPNSAAVHWRRGARSIFDANPRARHDVDTAHGLAEARRLGVGSHTAAAVAEIARAGGSASRRQSEAAIRGRGVTERVVGV